MGLAGLDLALALGLAEGILRRSDLPLALRVGLLAWDLLLLALGAALALAPALVVNALAYRLESERLASVVPFLAWLGVVVLVSFFAWSWASYWAIHHFLGVVGLRFLSTHVWQVAQHALAMRPLGFLALQALLVAFAAFYAWRLFRRRENAADEDTEQEMEMETETEPLLPRVTVAALVVCAAVAFLAPRLVSSETREDLGDGTIATARSELTGPAAYFWAEVRRPTQFEALSEEALAAMPIVRREIISPDEWRAQIDPDKVQRTNVLLVLVESLRPDELVSFGGRREVMPNLERLAADSALFPTTWTQSSHSNYADLCTLTGQYPLRDRTLYLYDSDSAWPRTLIYDLLSDLGWRTAIFSSQNERWGRMVEWLDTDGLDRFFHAETFDGETYFAPGDNNFVDFASKRKLSGKVDDRDTVSAAIDWIRSDEDTPFFVYLNLQNSHVPYVRPDDFPPRFGPEEVDFPVAFGRFPRDKVSVVRDLYSDSLAYVDHQLGRLLDALRDAGRLDDTIVLVTGDTGQAFYEHDFASHGSYLYEEVVRVPLVVRAPGLLAPGLDEKKVQHIDLPPTILDLLGLPPHPSHQGQSLASPQYAERPIFLVCQTPLVTQYAIVQDNWKLMLDVKGQKVELYDLENDPGERNDLARQRPDLQRRLLDQLVRWVFLQIQYHESPNWYFSEYPPILLPPDIQAPDP